MMRHVVCPTVSLESVMRIWYHREEPGETGPTVPKVPLSESAVTSTRTPKVLWTVNDTAVLSSESPLLATLIVTRPMS